MFRPFNAENFGSEGQRAAKLLAVKVGLLKKKSAALAIPAEVCASAFGPGSRTPGVQSFSKFDSWQLCKRKLVAVTRDACFSWSPKKFF